jgi:hypothetical protein
MRSGRSAHIKPRNKARLAAFLGALGMGAAVAGTDVALDRLKPENLKRTHESVEAFAKARKEVSFETGFRDFRVLIHNHSNLSHDSTGAPEEIAAAAKAVGARAVMMTEHPSDKYDFIADGLKGLRDGVLFIPGAEMDGYLVFPTRSIKGETWASRDEFVKVVKNAGGLVFLSHVEERLDWPADGIDGMEIYNIHSDYKDEVALQAELASGLQNIPKLWSLVQGFLVYPQEALASIQDYPEAIIRRWDELCKQRLVTGIAANDAHGNTGFIVKVGEQGKLIVEDPLGRKLTELKAEQVAALAPLAQMMKPGDTVFQLRLDPYEQTFRHCSNHLLLKNLTEDEVREALGRGRCYAAFDWMTDPTGFVFAARSGQRLWMMGEEAPEEEGLRLVARAPLECVMRLFLDGLKISEKVAAQAEWKADRAGVYRVEAWLDVAGELRPWIFSNPITVVASPPDRRM